MNLRKKKELLSMSNKIREKLEGINDTTMVIETMNSEEIDEYLLEVSRSIRNLREYKKQVLITSLRYDKM